MNDLIQLTKDVWCTDIPNDLVGVEIWEADNNFFGRKKGQLYVAGIVKTGSWEKPIPPGDYEIVAQWKSITEEQAKKIVRCFGLENGYQNYLVESQYSECLKKTAIESLRSLLKSKSLPVENVNYVFVRKLN